MEAETNVVWWLRTKVLPEQLADIFYSVRRVTWLLPTCAWFSWRFSLLLLMAAIHCACNGKWLPALRSSRLAKTRKDLFCTCYAISRNLTSRSCESLCFSKLQPSFAESALSRFSNGSQGNQGGYVLFESTVVGQFLLQDQRIWQSVESVTNSAFTNWKSRNDDASLIAHDSQFFSGHAFDEVSRPISLHFPNVHLDLWKDARKKTWAALSTQFCWTWAHWRNDTAWWKLVFCFSLCITF